MDLKIQEFKDNLGLLVLIGYGYIQPKIKQTTEYFAALYSFMRHPFANCIVNRENKFFKNADIVEETDYRITQERDTLESIF